MIKNALKAFGKSEPRGMDTPFRRSWVKLKRNKAALVGGIMLLIYVGCALMAPILFAESPTALNLMKSLEPPSLEDLLGTDELGRSILGRII
jgi:ABC-type dipeptide/oligopeptide/nickel transport system permease subunit